MHVAWSLEDILLLFVIFYVGFVIYLPAKYMAVLAFRTGPGVDRVWVEKELN